MLSRSVFAFFLSILSTFSTALLAQSDTAGASDHPMVGRYPGTYIIKQTISEFDETVLLLESSDPKTRELRKHLSVEGSVFSTVYESAENFSTLKVVRSYQKSLSKLGFKTLFSCNAEECGTFVLKSVYTTSSRKKHLTGLTYWESYSSIIDWRYLVSHREDQGINQYVVVIVAYPDTNRKPRVLVEVIQEEALQTEEIIVTIDQIVGEVAAKGSATLHGIYFDTGSTDLSAKSDAALTVIADYLKKNPHEDFLVVGHTDSTGILADNMTLSNSRARAVINALVKQLGVDESQLIPVGVGPSSPKASNGSEAGKQQNRRVELVLLQSK